MTVFDRVESTLFILYNNYVPTYTLHMYSSWESCVISTRPVKDNVGRRKQLIKDTTVSCCSKEMLLK